MITHENTYYVVLSRHSGGKYHAIHYEKNQGEAEILFLMDLNNYGGEYKLLKIEKTIEEVENQKTITTIETTIDMTEKIEEYKEKTGGLRSERY